MFLSSRKSFLEANWSTSINSSNDNYVDILITEEWQVLGGGGEPRRGVRN